MLANKNIAIVGGGPGGLTLAKLLQQKGIAVKVYERDEHKNVRVQGATLDLHEESGLEALKQAGLLDEFYKAYRPNAGRIKIIDKDGVVKMNDHTAKEYSEDRPEIDRAPLRKLLLNSLNDETVIWDSHFIKMEPYKDGWMLHFKNNTTAYADVVIAADGANSKIRKYITNITPIYSGITVVEGNIYHAAHNAPKLWEMVQGGKVFAFGDQQSLILSAKGEGSLSFYTGCKVHEDWVKTSGIDFSSKTSVQQWFLSNFGSWNTIWQELFTSDDVWFVPRPQYHYPLNQQWQTKSNVTMLGDAAHRMPPYAGEGVNMAMQDAVVLTNCLINETANMYNALQKYEQQMLQRAAKVTAITLESTAMLHSSDAIVKMMQMMNEVQHT
ncbi:FAD-dependent oxidoreductase [Zhouia sp. PK063]|uniref:FAD-dependent oxidoreductase n=1 Tax=Zhouia sp. PK063 TaxID=3373602 RepID=UPI0037B1637C